MNQQPEDYLSPLRAAVVTAVQQLLEAQGAASAALPMGDGQMILAGETRALARMLGYGAPAAAAEAYAITGATRFWLGRGPRGRMIFDREPNPADYPGITITAHVVMPLGAAGHDGSCAAVPQAGAGAAERLRAAYEAVGKVIEGNAELNLTRLHDWLGVEQGMAPEAMPCEAEDMLALRQPQGASFAGAGARCMSEDQCIAQEINFSDYERGVLDAIKACESVAAAKQTGKEA